MPYAQCRPVLNHCGELGAAAWRREHGLQLVVERVRVLLAEVAVLEAPVGPAAGQPAEHLARVGLALDGRMPARRLGRARSHSGTPSSATGTSSVATPALRQYFCARMSTATCDHLAGACSVASKTTEPSGLTMRDVRSANSTPAYGSPPVRYIAFRSALLPPRPRPLNGSPLRRGRRGRVGNTREPVGRTSDRASDGLSAACSLSRRRRLAGTLAGPAAARATMLAPQWTTATRSTSRAPSTPSRPSRRPSTPPACSGSASASPGTGSTACS